MSRKQTKRKAAPGAQRIAAKRAKLAKEGMNVEGKTISLGKKSDGEAVAKVVNVNELPWDSLGDEFMDVKVVENVEVVKEGDQVRFVVKGEGEEQKKKKADKKTEKQKKDKKRDQQKVDKQTENDNDDFTGFDDDDDDEPAAANPETPIRTENPPKQKKAKKTPPANPTIDIPSAFSVLRDLDDTTEPDMTAWAPLGLTPELLSALARLNFTTPTAIQKDVIPHILAGHDIIGKAATGTGKTLAFGLPIVDRWLAVLPELEEEEEWDRDGDSGRKFSIENPKVPTALILSPTRELARQIAEHLMAVSKGLKKGPYICSVTGGLAVVKQQRQISKADIVVATPGRLWELIGSGGPLLEAFKKIKFLVIDEADHLLADGSFEEAASILEALDRKELVAGQPLEEEVDEQENEGRQTLVFSATLSKALHQKLGGKGRKAVISEEKGMEYLAERLRFRDKEPVLVDVSPASAMATGLQEGLVQCTDAIQKDLYLYTVIALHPPRRTLIFTNAIKAVKRLVPFLQHLGFQAKGLHSQMLQKARLSAIEWVASSGCGKEHCVLVATDVAARGLDIPSMDQVIHYHVPRTADTYVHRSGRTARAQQTGTSILICTPEEATATRRLIGKIHANGTKQDALDEISTVQIDPRMLGKFKRRVELAKKIADATNAKEKGSKQESWLKKAADELGVEYDSEELNEAERRTGYGMGRREREKELRAMGKGELAGARAELREELARDRVGRGWMRRYVPGQEIQADQGIRWV